MDHQLFEQAKKKHHQEGRKKKISKIIKSLLIKLKNIYLQRRAFNSLEFCLFICFVFFH